ncbi:cadherin-15 isoform X4 [Cavia porcellus]|uniref:cadherin-15 isoform X4 n=1 Tax=Cavia porcellus TaxID=10141 RepID=UPI002FE3F127
MQQTFHGHPCPPRAGKPHEDQGSPGHLCPSSPLSCPYSSLAGAAPGSGPQSHIPGTLDLSWGGPGASGTLHPWRHPRARGRVRRAWVIPPISVSENYKGLPYMLVQIRSDKRQPGGVIYSIQGPGVDEEPLGLFSVEKFSGRVFLNAELDREKTASYRLKVFALDLGGSILEEPTDLEIVVVDQNDNRPAFVQEVFSGRVLEGAAPGTYVTRAEATDADDPDTDNAALHYSILEQGSPELFSIHARTGEIRTVHVGLDREVVTMYNLTLQVADMSGEGLTATASAIISVDDINDNAPEFTKDKFSMEATEAVSGVDVGRMEVEDQDLPGSPNWVANFTILEGDPNGHFDIRTDPRTNEGVLSVVKPLDYESCAHYELRVSVQNEAPLQAAPSRSQQGQARLSVWVQDINEAPVFPENPLRTSLAEGAPPGTFVATFSAQDPDVEQLQRVSYSKDYDPEDWLQVDGATGQIQTQRVLSPTSPFLKDGWYRAIVLALDDGSPPRTATGTLSVEILEVNDHAPALAPPPALSLCSEPDRGPGLLLGATDQDLPPHGAPFRFHLSPAEPALDLNWSLSYVNGTHARLRPRHTLSEGLHRLRLLLQDSGQPPQEREQLLNVTVCRCGASGACLPGTAALRAGGAGVGLGALALVLGSAAALLLLVLLVLLRARFRQPSRDKSLLRGLQDDDLRDNILCYNEQGGGEEDQDAYDLNQLRHPSELAVLSFPPGRPLLRREAPLSRGRPQAPRALPASPADIASFIRDGLQAADSDPSVPPYDTALIYDYEGDGSVAGTLSSPVSSLGDEDQDYDYLQDWGPRFARLADMYGHP